MTSPRFPVQAFSHRQHEHPKGTLGRRQFLRGTGVCIALPWLASMCTGKEPSTTPKKMLLISNNLGVLPKPFFPKDVGVNYQLSPYLQELAEYRDEFTVFSGLSHPDVIGGHSTENCFLTAARQPTRSGFRNQISLDQFAAEALGPQTRFPSLNLGVNIDRGKRSLSWTRDGALLPAEDSPAALYRKMFVRGNAADVARQLDRLKRRESLLDAVQEETRSLTRRVGLSDRRSLEQYLNSMRELEQRIQLAGEWEQKPKPETSRPPPTDIADDSRIFEKLEMMLSMAQLALESDLTRIVTLMVDAFETGVFQIDDQTKSINAYHNLSHHGNVPEKVEQLEAVDLRQMRILASQLKTLKEVQQATGTLLDDTMVLYGSNMGNANTHENTNLPILLAGGGFRHGQHLAFDSEKNTPLSNLFLSMLHRLGIEVGSFGTSTGSLNGLEVNGVS